MSCESRSSECFFITRDHIKLDSFLGAVNNGHDLGDFLSDRDNTEVCFNLVGVFEVEVQRDTLAFDYDVDEVETVVEVQFDHFVVFLELARCERDWDFDLFFPRHENLARHNGEI